MKRMIVVFLAIALLPACSRAEGETVGPKLEQTARDVVAMIRAYNCELMPKYMAPEAEPLWRSQIHGDLLDTGISDPIERVCFVLGTLEYPRSETMEVSERTRSKDRVLLSLSDGDRSADLSLVSAGSEWKIDHDWALKQVQDLRARLNVLSVVLSIDGYYLERKTFTGIAADPTDTGNTEYTFRPGLADASVAPNLVFLAVGNQGQSACVTTRSRSGEYFMARHDGEGATTYMRGAELPTSCPGDPLDPSW